MAMYNLACMLRDGRGMAADPIAASVLMLKAAEKGNAYAQAAFAWMLEKGVGVNKDFVKAAEWYHRAAEQGLSVGQIQLALLLASGVSGEKGMVAAYKWQAVSAGTGHEGAGKFLKTITKDMTEEQVTDAQALVAEFIAKPVIEDVRPEGPQG